MPGCGSRQINSGRYAKLGLQISPRKIYDLEVTYNVGKPNKVPGNKKTKSSATLHSIGSRWTALETAMKGKGYHLSNEDIANVVARYTGEQAVQKIMSSFYGGVAQLNTSTS